MLFLKIGLLYYITRFNDFLLLFRYEKLVQVNTALREQLEDAHETNEALANDLQKLSTDWADMRDEMIIKENEWKEEEQVCKK